MALAANFAQPFEAKKRAAGSQRDATLATNAYSRFLAQQRGSRSMVDIGRNMTNGLEKLATSHTSRGLGYSGVFGNAQSQYAQNWAQQNNDVTTAVTNANTQATLGDNAAWAGYDGTVADLEAQKQAQIAADAAHLAGFQPFLGS
jgi:hypothetical protein